MNDELRAWFGDRLSEDGLRLTIRLPQTFRTGALEIDEITLTEPNVQQVEEAQKKPNPIAQSKALIAIVGKVPDGAVNQLPISEFQRADRFLSGFTAGGPPDGAI
jgi:Phage tail assembly chaperone proteins, E, or 41 or 14